MARILSFSVHKPGDNSGDYYIGINTSTKQIVEFDMKFNSYYTWGDASIDTGVMDLQE